MQKFVTFVTYSHPKLLGIYETEGNLALLREEGGGLLLHLLHHGDRLLAVDLCQQEKVEEEMWQPRWRSSSILERARHPAFQLS